MTWWDLGWSDHWGVKMPPSPHTGDTFMYMYIIHTMYNAGNNVTWTPHLLPHCSRNLSDVTNCLMLDMKCLMFYLNFPIDLNRTSEMYGKMSAVIKNTFHIHCYQPGIWSRELKHQCNYLYLCNIQQKRVKIITSTLSKQNCCVTFSVHSGCLKTQEF